MSSRVNLNRYTLQVLVSSSRVREQDCNEYLYRKQNLTMLPCFLSFEILIGYIIIFEFDFILYVLEISSSLPTYSLPGMVVMF